MRITSLRHPQIALLFLITAVFFNDILAYLAGLIARGKTRLNLIVSPNKSLIGFIFGFATSIGVVIACSFLFKGYYLMSLPAAILLGALLALTAFVGDLFESALKRSCQVKDSGVIMAGRGGIMDAIDSLLLSAPLFLFLFVLIPPPARAEAVLEVSGSVASVAPRLEVRLVVKNRGDRRAAPIDVVGELLGERSAARLASGVGAGREGAVLLAFSPVSPRLGTHALTVLLEYPVEGTADAAGNPPMASEVAWLLVALGPSPPPAVRVEARPLRLDVRGDLAVRLESADSQPHQVHLRVAAASGLRVDGPGADVLVPGQGTASAALPIVRAAAPRGTRHGVLVIAETTDGPVARATVVPVRVEIAPFPSRLPGLRPAVLGLGLLLLAVALGFEVWRRFRA